MRRKNSARVLGPYQERGRWRLIVVEDGGRRSVFFPTHEEALKFKAGTEREIALPPARRIADVLAEWQTQRHREGQCKATTIDSQFENMKGFFAAVAAEDIAALTPRRAAALYQEARDRISSWTGRPLAVASHRLYLRLAQSFYSWATRQGYVGASPFRDVRPIGKVKVGKRQLRIEEARRFTSTALNYYEEKQRPLALGIVLALMMGLRTSEVLDRVVRDVDDGGRYLWIDAGKTANARRHLEVPEMMQPYLRQLTQGKREEDWLFGARKDGRPATRQTMWKMVQTLCQRAGVPIVCTHSLRGLWATLAIQSGAASHVVAANLGHHSFKVTERHYAQGAAVENAATARVLGRLGSDRAGRSSPREQLEQLSEGELARLLELLVESKKGGSSAN